MPEPGRAMPFEHDGYVTYSDFDYSTDYDSSSDDDMSVDSEQLPSSSPSEVSPNAGADGKVSKSGDLTTDKAKDVPSETVQLGPGKHGMIDFEVHELIQQGFNHADIRSKLQERYNLTWSTSYISKRVLAWKAENAEIVQAELDARMDDWHDGEDEELMEAKREEEEYIKAEIDKLKAAMWPGISRRILKKNPNRKERSLKGMKERVNAIENGMATVPIEQDPNDFERAEKLREQRTAAMRLYNDLKTQYLEEMEVMDVEFKAAQEAKKTADEERRAQTVRRRAENRARIMASQWRTKLYNSEADKGDWAKKKRDGMKLRLERLVANLAKARLQAEREAAVRKAHTPQAIVVPKAVKVEVTDETKQSPRMAMTDAQLDLLLTRRGLPRRLDEEEHDQVVARIAVADQNCSLAKLNDLLRAHVGWKRSTDKAIVRRRLAEADVSAASS